MRKFHSATIKSKTAETEDSLRVTLGVPAAVADEFSYAQGQHLPVRAEVDGKIVRRTYSICSSVNERELKLGIRIQDDGVFSNYIANELKVGDTLEVMPPYGHFNTALDENNRKTYLAFVAGSGITPIFSIAKTTLESEPGSRFVVFYGNRKRATTMFTEDLWALKNLYPGRLALHFIMSREQTEIDLYNGRLDGDKVTSLHTAFLGDNHADEIFLCGPNPMIDEVTNALTAIGYAAGQIHSERFRPGLRGETAAVSNKATAPREGTEITIVMDGNHQTFHMDPDAVSILDAALDQGLDLPYSCKGGVCSTCRTLLRDGEVEMAINYALEPWEVERGFILCCQASPKTESVVLDYDQT